MITKALVRVRHLLASQRTHYIQRRRVSSVFIDVCAMSYHDWEVGQWRILGDREGKASYGRDIYTQTRKTKECRYFRELLAQRPWDWKRGMMSVRKEEKARACKAGASCLRC